MNATNVVLDERLHVVPEYSFLPPQAKPVLITPEIAAQMLENNSVNRNVRVKTVEKYARDMENGHWAYTGDPIKFSTTGQLLDGQHRLSAIIKSGRSVVLPLITDLNPDSQKFMDAGDKRTAADALQLMGHNSAALLAAAARIGISYENNESSLGRSATVSNSGIEQWIEQHPDIINAVAVASRYKHAILCEPSMIAFTSWLIYQTVGEWDDIDAFWDAAAYKVGLKHGDPVIVLTNKFATDRAERKRRQRRAIASAIIRCWNIRRDGKTMSIIRFDSQSKDGQLIPIPNVTK